MTKKHFEALAAELKYSHPSVDKIDDPASLKQWDYDVKAVAIVCERFNPHFDRNRFFKACGLEVTQ